MRILIGLHQYFPEYGAGTETLAHAAAKLLIARGHEVLVFSGTPIKRRMSDEERLTRTCYEGVTIVKFAHQYVAMGRQTDLARMEYDSAFVCARFAALLAEWAPDVVHFFNFARISSSPMEVCSRLGVPFFYTATDFWAICPTAQLLLPDGSRCGGPTRDAANCIQHIAELKTSRHNMFISSLPHATPLALRLFRLPLLSRTRLSRMMASVANRRQVILGRLNRARAVLVPTRHMAETLVSNGLSCEVLRHVPYGIALTLTRPRKAPADDPLRIGFVGTLAPHKGAHRLLEAARTLSGEHAQFLIYGDPSQFPEYFSRLMRLAEGDARIEFRGGFPADAIGEVFAGLDLLVVPSLWDENAPLVVLWALASKCPVIASRQPGMAEMIRESQDGMLYEPDDVEGLAVILRSLVRDRKAVERLSDGCRSPRSIEDYVTEMEALYKTVRTTKEARDE